VAGIASGLESVSTPVTALLGVDMPWAGRLVGRLVAEFATCDAAALVPVDGSGFRQPLCAVVRTEAVRAALRELGDPAGRSLRELMSRIDVRERPLEQAEIRWVEDIDTPQDLREARSAGPPPRAATERGPASMSAWINAVCAELNLQGDVAVDVVLDVARVTAHHLGRQASPVTTFLLGEAVAGGMDVTEAAARIQRLAATWPTSAYQGVDPRQE
jgi:hypothetical protein